MSDILALSGTYLNAFTNFEKTEAKLRPKMQSPFAGKCKVTDKLVKIDLLSILMEAVKAFADVTKQATA